jgi:magnesium chelatase subunit I
MQLTEIKTLGELKKRASKNANEGIKEELRRNLIKALKNGENPFEGIHGYENTVIPELQRAILSKHNINLLGLRGQAKTRIARMMVNLLDEWMPIVAGSEVNDDPFNPLSRYAKDIIANMGDESPIDWVHRNDRFVEKLATPDVTVADLIGDVDPIKAANMKLSYADDRVIHFGMIPRANRCIFVINELPDLQARIQVALFNILQEGDIQIRGFKLRFPLDMQFVFTANPEDYTNRGSIVTPLKDRIGSQILTHYPESVETAAKITSQEIRTEKQDHIHVPILATILIEQIAFEARESEYVDVKSGVSARMSISAMECLISAAELRALKYGLKQTSVRLSDFLAIIPALTGKMEIAYEGEQEGARFVAEHLIRQAIKSTFEAIFPKIPKLQKPDATGPYHETIEWFVNNEDDFELTENMDDKDFQSQLNKVSSLTRLVDKYHPVKSTGDKALLQEMILWALVEHKKLSQVKVDQGVGYSGGLNELLKGL